MEIIVLVMNHISGRVDSAVADMLDDDEGVGWLVKDTEDHNSTVRNIFVVHYFISIHIPPHGWKL